MTVGKSRVLLAQNSGVNCPERVGQDVESVYDERVFELPASQWGREPPVLIAVAAVMPLILPAGITVFQSSRHSLDNFHVCV